MSFFRLPGISRHTGKPAPALRERAHRQLRDEHGAGFIQPFDNSRVVIDYLIAIRLSAKRRLYSLGGEKIFRAPRYSVQRAAILSTFDFSVRRGSLFEREIFGQGHDAKQFCPIVLQPREIHLRELSRTDPARANQFSELRDSSEGKVFDVVELR